MFCGSIQNAGQNPVPGVGILILSSTRIVLWLPPGMKAALPRVWMRPLVMLPSAALAAVMSNVPFSTRTLVGLLV